MSYSFNVRASSAGAAITAVDAELDKVVEQQPAHAEDRAEAFATADMLIRKLREPGPNEQLSVNVSGYLSKDIVGGLGSISVSVNAAVVIRED